MINKIFINITILVLMLVFSACGGGGGGGSSTTTTLADIILTAGESSVCTNATTFTVTPTDDPDVVFSTDAVSGSTTITVDSTSSGTLVIENCTPE